MSYTGHTFPLALMHLASAIFGNITLKFKCLQVLSPSPVELPWTNIHEGSEYKHSYLLCYSRLMLPSYVISFNGSEGHKQTLWGYCKLFSLRGKMTDRFHKPTYAYYIIKDPITTVQKANLGLKQNPGYFCHKSLFLASRRLARINFKKSTFWA